MEKTPRVTTANVRNYVNQRVRVVGRVVSNQNSQLSLQLEDSNNGQMKINLQNPYNCSDNAIIEVLGQVKPDFSVQEMVITPFSDNFDLKLYNQDLVTAIEKYPKLFM
ncbi:hypothetical protein MP228_011771 [Amoeboaphelidium protococcarum]|nr:hypothetical protein MP228_011771 [Amoeboaphelidium protococcarum]